MSFLFSLRNALRWEGKASSEGCGCAHFVPPTERGRILFDRYELARWDGRISRRAFDETLGVLDLLDRLEPIALTRILDVGAKDWRYLPALVSWLGSAREITGIELDAYRLYRGFTTGIGHARGMIRSCQSAFAGENLSYVAGDVRSIDRTFDCLTWFFPFIFKPQHRAWGLPDGLFDPPGTLAHAIRLLSPGGRLIMANQGEWEWEGARAYATSHARRALHGLRLDQSVRVEGSLHPSTYPIFVSVWTREQ